jgi:thymidylate synthase
MKPYDDALRQIIDHGVVKENRTGVRTRAIFGIQSRYDISERFPLVTGRKIPSRSVFGELLWFISGSTDNHDLQNMGVNIWTPWVDEEFEKKHYYASGCLGPVYGFQLRHFNGHYGDGRREQNHLGENLYGRHGYDQLAEIVKTLKENPNDRRIIFSLWNPAQLNQMRLPPCHLFFQLFVHENKLSGLMVQRSCDFPVGVPFNIAFYSALIYMLAQQTGFTPHEFIHVTNDSHVYEDQIPAIEEYLSREKPDSPKLTLKKAADMYSYTLDDFEITDYNPQPAIKIPVAV